LLGCVSFAGDSFRYARFLGLVSFDYHPGVVFLSHIGDVRCYCSSLSSPSDTNRSLPLSPQKATPVPTTTLALSSQKVTRSISLLRSPHRPTPFVVASCARSEDRALSLSSESRRCSRPTGRVYTTAKGASRRRPRHHPTQTPPCPLPLGLGAILCAITAAATPPPILLLGRALTL
jgi:hypothetical protein